MKVGMGINKLLPLTPPPTGTPVSRQAGPLDPDSYREGRAFGFMALAINALRSVLEYEY